MTFECFTTLSPEHDAVPLTSAQARSLKRQPSTIPIMSHLHLPQTYKNATTAGRKINKQGPISRRLEESRTCISKLS